MKNYNHTPVSRRFIFCLGNIQKMKSFFLWSVIIFLLSGCGGKTNVPIQGMDITVDLPSSWSIGMDTYDGELTAELSKDKKRSMKITEATSQVESVDMLAQAASKDWEVLNKETFANGFGITVKSNGKKQFLYYINKGRKQYKCEPAPYYEEEAYDEAIQIIKSIK